VLENCPIKGISGTHQETCIEEKGRSLLYLLSVSGMKIKITLILHCYSVNILGQREARLH
jgi:hypothetical protein